MADKITETGPLTRRFLTSQINKNGDINQYLTKQDRLDWANTHKDRLQGANVSLGADGSFADPKVERKFRNTKFSQLFKDDPQLTEHQKLSPAERDRMYVGYARTLQDRETAIRNEQAAIPATNEANKLQYRFEVTNPAAIRSRMEAATITPGVGTVLPELPEVLTDEEVAQRVEAVPNYQPVRDRYINDFDGTKRENDINTVKKLAPQLSHSYEELANNNLENEIDWERISPEIMNYLEEGNDIAASNVFNHNVNWTLSDNQTFGEAALNWGTRFVSNVGLMAVDLVGLVEGAGEALIGDILVPWVSGEGVDWAQAGATLLYDNTLANWSSDAQEYLRNELPIYTSTGVNDVLLDPESSAFMASMVIPGGTVTKLGKGVKTLGKTGKELARAQRWNRISGYAKDYEKAGKELEKVLGNPNHVSYRRLQELGREAEYSALKEGRSISQAQKEAQEIQQAALTDIYRRGTIQRNQIRLSSILEGQQEALGTKKESLNEFEQAWDKKVYQLTEAALRGEIDTTGWDYNIADAEKWQNELFNDADYMQQLTTSLQKMASEQGYALSEAEAIHYMNEWITKEAIIRAQLDNYTAKEKPEYEKLASDQANLAGTLTFANNYILLRFSEGLGGWTTRVPTYKRIAPMAKEHKSFLGGTREALGGITSFGSETANMGSRIGFNEAGQAIRRVTPKSVAQTAGKIGGTMGIEIGQELMQELYSSSNIGTSAWNAEAFLANHFDGRGSEAVNQEYQSQLLAFMRHAGYGRDWEDYLKIIKSTGAQMLFGVPSVSKYRSFSRRTDKFTGKKYLDDNVRRGSYESAPSYWFRKIEAWTPMNSPIAQSTSQVLNTNSNVNTFINTYNNLLEESRAYSGYAASSMNYAARAFDAANRGDETDYEHSKFAAQVAEATFMAQLRGKNQQTKMAYYHNLADINTKRAGETDEGFAARRANTLKELREGAMYNSLKNASDEELSTWAESNGKQMLELIDNAAAKSQQLYDQYDGNISWEQIYGTIYDDALVNYTNARIKEIEDSFKQLSANLTDTKLDEKDLTDKNGKPIHILTESEIMRLAPDARQELIEKAEGKQKEIVDSLMTQLETNNLSLGLNRNVKDDFKNSAKEYQINKEATEEIGKIMHNPESFLRNIRKSKERAATRKIFNDINSILTNKDLVEEDKRDLIAEELDALGSSEIGLEGFMALTSALDSMKSSYGKLINDIMKADRMNGLPLENLVSELIKNSDESVKDAYVRVKEKIQNSHYAFDDDAILTTPERDANGNATGNMVDRFTSEEKDLLDNIRQRYNEVKLAAPVVEVTEDRVDSSEDPDGKEAKPTPVEQEEVDKENVEDLKQDIRNKLQQALDTAEVPNVEAYTNPVEEILGKDYADETSLVTAFAKLVHSSKGIQKTIYRRVLQQITRENPERIETNQERNTTKLSLADPSLFLNWEETAEGNFAKFYRKYKIVELLRSGHIKTGMPIYVMWDQEFIDESKEMYQKNTGLPFTQNQIGLVALIEGSFDGFESVTIGDKTYTRIGLFRAYGKSNHNSNDVVANLVSLATGNRFDISSEDIPNLGNKIVSTKGNPVSFTISAMNESFLTSTPGETKDLKGLSEERQEHEEKQNNSYKENDREGMLARAKKWFIDSLKLSKTQAGKTIPVISIPRHNSDGEARIPIQIKGVTETEWNGTTVGEALNNEEQRLGLVAPATGIPVFNRVAEALQGFMTDSKVQPAVKDFLRKLEKLNKKNYGEARYQKEYNKLLAELNEKCNSVLNGKKGNTLYNRLSLPKDMEYYVGFELEQNPETGETTSYFTIGVKLKQAAQGNLNFIRFEAPRADGTTTVVTSKQVADALYNLIIDPTTGEARRSNDNDEFVKWQLNYTDIENKAGIAEELLGDLYDMNVFVAETETLISDQLDIDITPNDAAITKVNEKPEANPVEGNSDMTGKPQSMKSKQTGAEKTAKTLGLSETSNAVYTDEIEVQKNNFQWGREGIELNGVKVRFIGLTEDNDMTIMVNESTDLEAARLALTEYLENCGLPSEFNLVTLANKTQEATEVKAKQDEDSISSADEMRENTKQAAKAEETQKSDEEYKETIENNLLEYYADSLVEQGLLDEDYEQLDTIIENLKNKYGSYQNAWNQIYSANSAEEIASIIQCS